VASEGTFLRTADLRSQPANISLAGSRPTPRRRVMPTTGPAHHQWTDPTSTITHHDRGAHAGTLLTAVPTSELRNDLAGQAATRTLAALPVGGAAEAWESRGLSWRHAVLAAVVQRVVLHPCLPGRNAFDPSRIEVLWRT
jgi:hypothetical protein